MTHVPTTPAASARTARVGDVDRERVAGLLSDAVADGLVRLDEIDDRLDAVWTARTAADLAAVTDDLSPDWLADRRRAESVARARQAARAAFRGHAASYAGVMLLLVAIWLVTGLAAGAWYPWPVWPALGWGIGLASHARAAYGRPAVRGGGWGMCTGRRAGHAVP